MIMDVLWAISRAPAPIRTPIMVGIFPGRYQIASHPHRFIGTSFAWFAIIPFHLQ